MRYIAAFATAAALVVAGCGSSSSGSPASSPAASSTTSSANADYSSPLAQEIQQNAPGQFAQNNPGGSLVVSDMSCVRSGDTQSYSCIGSGTEAVANSGVVPTSQQLFFNGTCDNTGSCSWESQ